MKLFLRALQLLVSLGVLVVFVWILVTGIRAAILFLQNLDSDLATTVVAAGTTAVLSIASIALSKAYETRASIRQDLRAKKTPVYESIFSTLFRVMFASVLKEEPMDEKSLMRFFADTTESLTIWGSDPLLLEWGKFKTRVGDDSHQALFLFEDLLLAIRKDLGHKNRNVKRGDVLRLFVTDIDEYLKK